MFKRFPYSCGSLLIVRNFCDYLYGCGNIEAKELNGKDRNKNYLFKRAKLLKRFSELKTEQDEVCKQLRDGGDVAILTPRYTELANALDEVKRELESIGEIYSTDNLAETCGSIEAVWEELFPAERYKLAHQLIDKITLYADHIVMDVKHYGLKSLRTQSRSGCESVPAGKQRNYPVEHTGSGQTLEWA
ncbi:MAG: hypothetical protein PHV82_07590 [Victivallaceae bacterium]|nr:hypothetical protein [Victivallaceae bacterium]